MSFLSSPKAPDPTPAPSYADTLKQQKDIAAAKENSIVNYNNEQNKLGANQLRANGTGLRIF